MFIGFFVAIIPFSGLPIAWRTSLAVLSGVTIMFMGFLMRRSITRMSMDEQKEKESPVSNTGDDDSSTQSHGVSPI